MLNRVFPSKKPDGGGDSLAAVRGKHAPLKPKRLDKAISRQLARLLAVHKAHRRAVDKAVACQGAKDRIYRSAMDDVLKQLDRVAVEGGKLARLVRLAHDVGPGPCPGRFSVIADGQCISVSPNSAVCSIQAMGAVVIFDEAGRAIR